MLQQQFADALYTVMSYRKYPAKMVYGAHEIALLNYPAANQLYNYSPKVDKAIGTAVGDERYYALVRWILDNQPLFLRYRNMFVYCKRIQQEIREAQRVMEMAQEKIATLRKENPTLAECVPIVYGEWEGE